MLNKGFNITKSCVQNDFHQNWEFKFKFNLNKLEKRYTNSINCLLKMRIKDKSSVHKIFLKRVQKFGLGPVKMGSSNFK